MLGYDANDKVMMMSAAKDNRDGDDDDSMTFSRCVTCIEIKFEIRLSQNLLRLRPILFPGSSRGMSMRRPMERVWAKGCIALKTIGMRGWKEIEYIVQLKTYITQEQRQKGLEFSR